VKFNALPQDFLSDDRFQIRIDPEIAHLEDDEY
jgi:hypothetical protein